MTKKSHPQNDSKTDDTTGTYIFDKNLGKVVKVSSKVPGVSAKGKGGGFDDMSAGGGCEGCPSGGSCGMGGMGGMGGGDFGGGF
jgi:hypothetical protein